MKKEFPILEFDAAENAIINPGNTVKNIPGLPEHAVACFFQDVIDHFASAGLLKQVATLRSEMGLHPVYIYEYENIPIVLFQPGVGAALSAGLLEEVIALGCKKFIYCGGAGVLDKEIVAGHLIIPDSAVRDEGTSYHYAEPSREIAPTDEALHALKATLDERNIAYLVGKTWTTDAIYRETPSKVSQRKSEGCLTVEMEAAAVFAVARFRNVKIAHILYAGDNLDSEIWDHRNWQSNWTVREKLVALAAEACLKM